MSDFLQCFNIYTIVGVLFVEDKRVQKTKKCLKGALLELGEKKPIEKISVTEICDLACTGRVTFYTYYDDKYDLLRDCFNDLKNDVLDNYKKRREKSSVKNVKTEFLNLYDAIQDEVEKFNVQGQNLLSSPDMLYMFYQFVVENLEEFELKCGDSLLTKYDRKQINSFLVFGLWGFVHARTDTDRNKLRRDAHQLVSDLLDSKIFDPKA